MKRLIKVLGYMPRGSCGESKSYPMEEKHYKVDAELDKLQWFVELCDRPRSDVDFIPCIMLNDPKEVKCKPSLWGLH